jgi:hypothetical protein
MPYVSRPYASIPQGNWNWSSVLVSCNGSLWAGVVDIYEWGSYAYTASAVGGWGYAQDPCLQLFKVSPDGWEKVIGGYYNWSDPSLVAENYPDGYGPDTSLGWGYNPTYGITADERYIYITQPHLCQIRRFDTETYQLKTIAGVTSGYSSGIVDGPGLTARLQEPHQIRYVPDRNALYFWDADQDNYNYRVLLRKYDLDTGYVSTIYDAADHPKWVNPLGFAAAANNGWLGDINSATGLPHKLDSDVIYNQLTGLVYHDGYLYWGEGGGDTVETNTYWYGALRRIPVDGGPIELLMTDAKFGYTDVQKAPIPSNPSARYYTYNPGGNYYLYGLAHDPNRQPEQIFYNWPFEGQHDMELVDGQLVFIDWGNSYIEYHGGSQQQRLAFLDLENVLANAPLRVDRYNPPWVLNHAYPAQPHTKHWGDNLYWREGSDWRFWYIPYGGLAVHEGKLNLFHHLNWLDYVTETFESWAVISVLDQAGAGSGGDIGFRVKFEGPALQAYAAVIPTTITTKLGVFQLS